MQKLKLWILILLNWLFIFGTPIVAGYVLLLADEPTQITGFFYLVVAVTGVAFAKKITSAIKKMKASFTKAIFKVFLSLVMLYVVWVFVSYVGFNFAEIAKVLLFSMCGRLLGFVCEMLALKIDASYIEEIGVI